MSKPTRKISHEFYTVGQYREAAILKMRKAAEALTAAEEETKVADELLSRANGDPNALAIDHADRNQGEIE